MNSEPVRFRTRRFPLALLVAALFLPAGALLAAAPPPAPRVDLRALPTAKDFDRFIVKFRAGSEAERSAAALDGALSRASARAGTQLRARRGAATPTPAWNLRVLRRLAVGADVFVASRRLDRDEVRELLTQLGADPQVEYVEIDQVLHEVMTPNDTSYASEWGLHDTDAGIRADRAWDLGNGSGVVVAVIDTGYSDHSDLGANILPGYDFITSATRANDGDGRDADAHDPGNWTESSLSNWHGTHVSGTIAAVTNNAKGIAGAAFGAKIVPVRALGVGGGDGSDIADAIVWASGGSVTGAPVNANPAEVLNLSLGGGGGCSATYQAAINGAVSRGSLVVVAAGNENLDASSGSLSTCNNVVVVGAHTSSAARSSFSNYGAQVDLTAPGSAIYSTINTGNTVPGAEGYANYQGTSMATPHVASAAALAQAYRVARGLAPYTPAQLEAQLKATAYPLSQGCAASSGAGIVDARTLLDSADGAFKLLADGVAQANQSAATGAALGYAMVTTTKAQGLSFSSSGGSGDADLYVKFGSAPTTSSYDCRSGNAGNGESCTIALAQPGTYYVLLQAASAFSGVSLTGSASGNRKPVAAFNHGSSGLTANFTDTSSDADGGVTSRSWKFGDNTSSTVANPNHNYSLAGAYTVQLTANDAAGASNCVLKQVNVNPPPVALANGVAVSNLAGNVGALLTYTLAVPAGTSNLSFGTSLGTGDADLYVKFGSPPSTTTFDCASGSPTTVENCAIGSSGAGTWYVLVHAFSNISGVRLIGSHNGAASNVAPTANFNSSTSALTATFTDASTDSDGSIASRNWNFGDGSTSTATNPAHTYASAGSYTVQLTVTDNGGLSNSVSKQVTVASGGGPNLSINDVSLTEGNAGIKYTVFTLSLSAPAPAPVAFSFATSGVTATSGVDFQANSGSNWLFNTGESSKSIYVAINGDTTTESDETFNVTVSGVTGASVVDGTGVGTISNDDGAPSGPNMSINDVSISEGNSGIKYAVFTLSLSAPAPAPVSFSFTTASGSASSGEDFQANSGSGWTFNAGESSKSIYVAINGDTTSESDETFTVTVSNVTGATLTDGQGVGTISNDDGGGGGGVTPQISIANVTLAEGNSGTKLATFTVQLSQASAGNVGYSIATLDGTAKAGSDYVASSLSGQVIPAGQLSKTFSVSVIGDTTRESNERFKVNLSGVTGATVLDAQGVGTITNDD